MQKLKVIYEDNHIIVVEKIPNIPSQADKTNDIDMLTIVKKYIKEKYNKPGEVYLGLVHRLDRPVGGIMVFAKTSKAASRLSEEVRSKVFKKEYLAIVENTKNAKYAKLDFKVLTYNEEINLSVLKINLHTGRHHQIRVQLSSRNHSIYADQKYGTRGRGKQINLWAYSLTLIHPITKQEMTFKSIPEKIGSWKILENIEL